MHTLFLRSLRCFCAPHLLLAATLLVGANARNANAADKEKRQPDSPAFDSLANQIVYVDRVTPAGEVLPKTSEIWTVFSDGLGKLRLTTGHKDTNPRFGTDGKHIIFERDGDGEIWMVNTLGGDLRNVTNTPDVYEHDAHFANDGDSLFFLAPGPSPFTAEELAKEPLLALGLGDVVVQLNLKDGSRRQLLSHDYHPKMVFPDPDDDKSVLVLCNSLKSDGKPSFIGEKVLVSVPLNGDVPRSVLVAPKGYKINTARSGGPYLIFGGIDPTRYTPQVFLIPKSKASAAAEVDLQKLDKLAFLGDLSCEGTSVVGTGPTGNIGKWGLFVYDIPTNKWHTVLEE